MTPLAGATVDGASAGAPIRVRARIAIRAARRAGIDDATHLVEQGGYRARVTGRAPLTVHVINPTGGLAGGDAFELDADVGPDAALTVTTPAPERVYRSTGALTRVRQRLSVAERAHLTWLPQPTAFHDGASYRRRLEVDVDERGSALIADVLAFGRAACGETLADVDLHDSWRIRRGGRLVYAEALRVDAAAAAALRAWPPGAGDRAAALCVYVGPDAVARCDAARAAAERTAGAAAHVDDVLVARWVAPAVEDASAALRRFLSELDWVRVPRGW